MKKTKSGKRLALLLTLALMAGLLPTTALAYDAPFSFGVPISTPVINGSVGMVSGEFNGDGKKDLITYTQDNEAKYTVLLGDGSGGFVKTVYPLGPYLNHSATGMACGDFNKDGKTDFICGQGMRYGINKISVYLGVGDGTFALQSDYDVPYPQQIILSDFNQDGLPDAAIGSSDANPANVGVYVLLGKADSGDGKIFESPIALMDGFHVKNLVGGDFDNDGWADLAFSPFDQKGLYILYNNKAANGASFTTSSVYDPDYYVEFAASGDINKDNKSDLIFRNSYNDLYVLLSQIDNTLLVKKNQSSPSYCNLSVADLNADGAGDILARVGVSFTSMGLFEVAEDGTIGREQTLGGGSGFSPEGSLLCADFDSDGAIDIAALHSSPGEVLFFRNTGSDRISGVSLDATEHEAGTEKIIRAAVSTKNIDDGTLVSASLLKTDGTELSPGVSASSMVSSNKATLELTVPATVPRGKYLIETTLTSGGSTYTYQSAYQIYAYGTIAWNSSAVEVREDAGAVTLTVSRANGGKGDVDLGYTLGGTAVLGTDYTEDGPWTSSNQAVLRDGFEDNTASINLKVTNDSLKNGDRTIIVTLDKTNSSPVSGLPATATITIKDDESISAPIITSAAGKTVNAGVGGTFQVTATGTTPITYSLSGQPHSVSINSASGLMIIGNTVSFDNNSVFTVTASNGILPNATQAFTLTVINTPVIRAAGLLDGTVGEPYHRQLPVTGAEPITWSLAGSLPRGLSLSANGTISGTPTTAGTSAFDITATNSLGSDTDHFSLTIKAAASPGGGGGGTPSTGYSEIKGSKDGNGNATIEITSTAPKDAKTAEVTFSKESMTALKGTKTTLMTVKTPIAMILFDDKAVAAIEKEAGSDIKITTDRVPADSLSAEAKLLIGDHQVYSFAVTSGNKTISQFGGNVEISVPYTPKAGEDPKAIVIYYINAQGKPEMVKNCVYDEKTGMITFTTNHFSQYAVGYHAADFSDVNKDSWYADAVTFLAARGITTGMKDGSFQPNGTLTRGQFLVMTMRAYGISPLKNAAGNFADAGDAYYTDYLAAAKSLGIANGIGNNMFAPDKAITRQEMFTLLYHTLKQIGELPSDNSGTKLTDFSDADQTAPWAADAVTLLVKSGTITGNDGKLQLKDTTTRAQMAQVLYNLLSK